MSSRQSTSAPIENELAGERAEIRFQSWMDVNRIDYFRIDQEPDTIALTFKGFIRRPDYFIRMKHIGATIAIDVKSRRYDVDYDDFIVDEEDITLLAAFQERFGVPVWIVLSTPAITRGTGLPSARFSPRYPKRRAASVGIRSAPYASINAKR